MKLATMAMTGLSVALFSAQLFACDKTDPDGESEKMSIHADPMCGEGKDGDDGSVYFETELPMCGEGKDGDEGNDHGADLICGDDKGNGEHEQLSGSCGGKKGEDDEKEDESFATV